MSAVHVSVPHPTMPKDRKFYLLLGGNLLVLAIIGALVLRPVLGLLVKHTSQIADTKAQIAGEQSKMQKLQQLKEALPEYQLTYAPILSTLPKEKDIAAYQAEIDDLAKTTSVTLKTVDSPSGTTGSGGAAAASAAKKPAGQFPASTLKMEVNGTFATVLDFVSRLESLDRFTKVSSLDVQSDASGAVKASLEVQAFYLP